MVPTDFSSPCLSGINLAVNDFACAQTETCDFSAVPNLSVVIPCFNEEESLEVLCDRVINVCKSVVGDSYELVLVNDGSSDATWSKMTEAARRDSNIVAVDLARNYGHQMALTAGLQICRGQRVFIIDADLQDPPELLDSMMKRMDAGADVVYGQRIHRDGETPFKKVTAHVFYRILNMLIDIDIPNDAGDFRLINRRVVKILNAMPENHRFIRGMVAWVGLRQEAFPYERAARYAGETKYPLRKMIRFALDAITGFSTRPLKLAAYMGASFGLVGIALLVYVLVAWSLGTTVHGWTSLIAVVLVLGSAQLVMLGVIGEYLGRLYIETKRRPLFVVKEVLRKLPHE